MWADWARHGSSMGMADGVSVALLDGSPSFTPCAATLPAPPPRMRVVSTMADCARGLLVGLLGIGPGCGEVSQSPEQVHEIRFPELSSSGVETRTSDSPVAVVPQHGR